MTLEEFDLADRRRFYQRVIAEALVFPRSEPHRLRLRWQGAENSIVVQPFKPVKLAQADPIAELQKAAARRATGTQSAISQRRWSRREAQRESLHDAALPDTGIRISAWPSTRPTLRRRRSRRS